MAIINYPNQAGGVDYIFFVNKNILLTFSINLLCHIKLKIYF